LLRLKTLVVCPFSFPKKTRRIPQVLNFLGAKINYGGRVTDGKDKLLPSGVSSGSWGTPIASHILGHLHWVVFGEDL
jgi:hypothetical protein